MSQGHTPTSRRQRLSSFVLQLRPNFKSSMADSSELRKAERIDCTFHKLPPELREEIFKPLCIDWPGKMPNLIMALRPEHKLYAEALAIFYKHNVFKFHSGNGWSFGDMTKEAVLTISKVTICVEADTMRVGLWKLVAAQSEERLLADASNVREVNLEFKHEEDSGIFPPFVVHGGVSYSPNYFLTSFGKLRRVMMSLPLPLYNGNAFLHQVRENIVEDGLRMANSRLGASPKLLRVLALHIQSSETSNESSERAWVAREEWFWQAKEGSYLKEPRTKPSPRLPEYTE